MSKTNKNTERDTSILNISVNMKSGTFEGNLEKDLEIDIDNLSESYVDQPAKYAWWSILAAQARAIVNNLDSEIDNLQDYIRKTLKGELDAEVRKQLELDGERVTETKVESGIYSHKKYVENMEKLHELRLKHAKANENASILESARNAMDQRKDMLISIGAHLRADLGNTDIKIKKDQARQILNKRKL